MTLDDLVTAVRLEFERHHAPWREFIAEHDKVTGTAAWRHAETYRLVIEHHHALFASSQFRNLSAGFQKAGVADPVLELVALVQWLDQLKALTALTGGPLQFEKRIETRTQLVSLMRAAELPFFSDGEMRRLRLLSDEIEKETRGSTSQIFSTDGAGQRAYLFSTDNVGRRGPASDPKRAWMALFVRELRDHLLPEAKHFTQPDAMIAYLLRWAGKNGAGNDSIFEVTSNFVRSTPHVKRAPTRR